MAMGGLGPMPSGGWPATHPAPGSAVQFEHELCNRLALGACSLHPITPGGTMTASREKNEPRKLPMMPIRDMVIFPYMMTPFVVGRDSSVQIGRAHV